MEKSELLKLRQNDEWSYIANAVDVKYIDQKREFMQTHKAKRVEVKNYILNQINTKVDEEKIKKKEVDEIELKKEVILFNEYQMQEQKKISDKQEKVNKIKEQMDKVVICNIN